MKHIIALGGNGFIGYEVVRAILGANSTDVSITLINRGRSWEWNKEQEISRDPRVHCIKWDRKQPLADCEDLTRLSDSVTQFAAVLDFSGYDKRAVKDSVKYFSNNTSLYIYLSSDSVYEVCMKPHPGPTTEGDSVRPHSHTERKALKCRDSYGHKKLEGEECLHKYSGEHMRYVTLRLADVAGPRDSTERWWQYQLWVRAALITQTPVHLPHTLKCTPLSLVYVKDIADLIARIITQMDGDNGEWLDSVSNTAYNLAFRETLTVEQLLRVMEKCLKKHTSNLVCNDVQFSKTQPDSDISGLNTEFDSCKQSMNEENKKSNHSCSEEETNPIARATLQGDSTLQVIYSEHKSTPHIFPSVEKGPISIEKACLKLSWTPTELEKAVSEIVDFYEIVHRSDSQEFLTERKDVYETLCEDLDVYEKDVFVKIRTCLKEILHL